MKFKNRVNQFFVVAFSFFAIVSLREWLRFVDLCL